MRDGDFCLFVCLCLLFRHLSKSFDMFFLSHVHRSFVSSPTAIPLTPSFRIFVTLSIAPMDFLRSLTPTHDISTNHDYTRDAFPAKTHQAAYTENARQSVPDMSIEALRALGVQTLDEWINTPTQEPSSSNPAPQNTTTTTKHTSPLSSTSATTPSVLAVPLGGPRTSEHVKQLYQLCQVRGLVPEFEYEKKGERWGAVLKVAGRVVEAQGSFASKMEGKEVCAREGCGIVEALPVRGAGGGDGDGAGADGLKRLQEENWVGMLLGVFTLMQISMSSANQQAS